MTRDPIEETSDQVLRPSEEGLLRECAFLGPWRTGLLKSGRNNQALQVTDGSGRKAVLKRYFHHPGDRRDRLRHETSFLAAAVSMGLSERVPGLLGSCENERIALLEFVEGSEIRGTPSDSQVETAIDFAVALNRDDARAAAELPDAADACFTIGQHFDLVERRVARFDSLEDDGGLVSEVKAFVRERLQPVLAKLGAGADREGFDRNEVEPRVVSPSDFGFHNALVRQDGSVCFLDFEYAGWDGVGKMVADFFCQPQVPVDERYLDRCVEALEVVLPEGEGGKASRPPSVSSRPAFVEVVLYSYERILRCGSR